MDEAFADAIRNPALAKEEKMITKKPAQEHPA